VEKGISQKLKSAVTQAFWETDDVDQDGVLLCGWMYRSTGHRGRKRRVPGTNRRRGFAKQQKKWTRHHDQRAPYNLHIHSSPGAKILQISHSVRRSEPAVLSKFRINVVCRSARVWGLGISLLMIDTLMALACTPQSIQETMKNRPISSKEVA